MSDELDVTKIGDKAANFTIVHELSKTVELEISEDTAGTTGAKLKVKF